MRHALPLDAAIEADVRGFLARSTGLLKPGTVSLDGVRVQANASRNKMLSREFANRIEAQLQAEVEQLMVMAEAAEVDVPTELKRHEDHLAAIRAARAETEARAAAYVQPG